MALLLAGCVGGQPIEPVGEHLEELRDDRHVEVCHRGQTLRIALAALRAHLAHGDDAGGCPSGCTATACDDGDLCTSDTCTGAGTCEHVAVSCDDGNACTLDSCAPDVGCTSAPRDGDACDDGNDCTGPDACRTGACAGAPIDGCCGVDGHCDDGALCTVDRCIGHACANTAVACGDGDRCQAAFCDPTTGVCASTQVSCDDANPCTADGCDPESGCFAVTVADGTECEYEEPGTTCQAGTCVSPWAGTITRLSVGDATASQNTPAISGTQVTWTNVEAPGNLDVHLYDLTAGTGGLLTETPADQELMQDIDAGNVVWTHAGTGGRGDIVLHETATGSESIIASSSANVGYQSPSIRGRYVTYLRVGASGTDVELYDVLLGLSWRVTNDAAVQSRPRVGSDFVVYEDYSSGDGDIWIYTIAEEVSMLAAGGPGNQLTPHIDGTTMVYTDDRDGLHAIVSFDILEQRPFFLMWNESVKLQPRISGSRIVWSDDRNGNLDIYTYDLATRVEHLLVGGAGDQFQADIDGDRVVYTDNASGFESIYLFVFTL